MKKLLFLALVAPMFLAALYTCNNADGGNNPGVYGDCTDIAGPHEEYCLDSHTLVEYYCPTEGAWGVVCQKEEVMCSGGCVDGACITTAKETPAPTQEPLIATSKEELKAEPTRPPITPKENEAVDVDYIKFVLFGLIVFVAIAYLVSTWMNASKKPTAKKRKIAAPKRREVAAAKKKRKRK